MMAPEEATTAIARQQDICMSIACYGHRQARSDAIVPNPQFLAVPQHANATYYALAQR